MLALGLALAALIGLSLGLLGGGGSILTVPILVYVIGIPAKTAIAMSLPVVGVTSAISALMHWRLGNVRVATALGFGALAMIGAFAGAKLSVLLSGTAQLALLGVVMLAASGSMLRRRAADADGAATAASPPRLRRAGPHRPRRRRAHGHRGHRRRLPGGAGARAAGPRTDARGRGHLAARDRHELGRGLRRLPRHRRRSTGHSSPASRRPRWPARSPARRSPGACRRPRSSAPSACSCSSWAPSCSSRIATSFSDRTHDMFFQRFYDKPLAQASYMIGCQRTGEAVVVDPNRDVQQYLDTAAKEGLRVTHVTETHIHADFVSGARELAAAHRRRAAAVRRGRRRLEVRLRATPTAPVCCKDGDHFMVGNVRLDVMHTPGHTPEHLSFVVTDTPAASGPWGILTGDFVFVGDVGPPRPAGEGRGPDGHDGGRRTHALPVAAALSRAAGSPAGLARPRCRLRVRQGARRDRLHDGGLREDRQLGRGHASTRASSCAWSSTASPSRRATSPR